MALWASQLKADGPVQGLPFMVFERADYTKTLDILDPKLVMANSGFKPIEQFKSQVFSFSKQNKKSQVFMWLEN